MEIMPALPHCRVTGPGSRFSLQQKHQVLKERERDGLGVGVKEEGVELRQGEKRQCSMREEGWCMVFEVRCEVLEACRRNRVRVSYCPSISGRSVRLH